MELVSVPGLVFVSLGHYNDVQLEWNCKISFEQLECFSKLIGALEVHQGIITLVESLI